MQMLQRTLKDVDFMDFKTPKFYESNTSYCLYLCSYRLPINIFIRAALINKVNRNKNTCQHILRYVCWSPSFLQPREIQQMYLKKSICHQG